MKKLLHGMILTGVLLAAAHPAGAHESAQANNTHAARQGPSDKAIQAEFDHHKKALYEIYLRVLKKNPKVAGKMNLRITIAPDGHVSACSVINSTLHSHALLRNFVREIRSFNFGEQKGMRAVTIKYGPIVFFPQT